MCSKHPLQDHGERAKKIVDMAKASTTSFLKRSYNELIKGQIEKIEAAANIGSKVESDDYRISMEEAREKASKMTRRKFSSDEHEELSRRSGLNPAALAAMLDRSDSEAEDENNGELSRKKSSHKGKKDKKEKKEKKEKKDKKDKKEKKSSSKKDKKSSRRNDKSSRDSSSSSSENEDESNAPRYSRKMVDSDETSQSESKAKPSSSKDSSNSNSYYGLV